MIAVFDGWISDIHFFQPFFFVGKNSPNWSQNSEAPRLGSW